jgi:hypothetical protein
MEICSVTMEAWAACARRPPGGRWMGAAAPPGDPDSFGFDAVSRPAVSPSDDVRLSYLIAAAELHFGRVVPFDRNIF